MSLFQLGGSFYYDGFLGIPAPAPIPDGFNPPFDGLAASGPFEFALAPALFPHPPLFLSSGLAAPPATFPPALT